MPGAREGVRHLAARASAAQARLRRRAARRQGEPRRRRRRDAGRSVRAHARRRSAAARGRRAKRRVFDPGRRRGQPLLRDRRDRAIADLVRPIPAPEYPRMPSRTAPVPMPVKIRRRSPGTGLAVRMREVRQSPANPRFLATRGAEPWRRCHGPASWWIALGVLVLNDHLLKYAGVLSGWLTGKLSDVAGLIVAPVLAARLVRARTPGTRALAFAAVRSRSSPSSSPPLPPTCWSRLWGQAEFAGACGATPATSSPWWSFRSRGTSRWRRRRSGRRRLRPRRAAGAVPVILGALACLATSDLVDGFYSSAFLINMTLDRARGPLYRARGPLDCAAIAAAPMNALASAFDPGALHAASRSAGSCRWIETGAPARCCRTAAARRPARTRPAMRVIIRIADQPDTLLTWQQPGQIEVNTAPGLLARRAERAGARPPRDLPRAGRRSDLRRLIAADHLAARDDRAAGRGLRVAPRPSTAVARATAPRDGGAGP